MLRTACPLAAAALLTVVTAGATPAGAAPQPLDLTCTAPSSNVVSYSPALTNTPSPHVLQTNTQYGPCVSPGHPGVTSGSTSGTVPPGGDISCLTLLVPTSVTFPITWNTGQTSTVSANIQSSIEGVTFVVVLSGTVTSGLFAGDTYLQTNVGAASDILLCNAGLGSVQGVYSTVTLEITAA
ncbi:MULTISPECIES: hypothetical protein [Kitasatospora]|nr:MULTISPECIES: hypothetical protein [Kitasatospora]